MRTKIARRLTIPEIVRVYVEAVENITTAFRLLSDTQENLNDTFALGESHRSIRIASYFDRTEYGNPKDAFRRVRRGVWEAIVERLELRRMMSIGRWAKLQKDIEDDLLPDITEENVARVLSEFQGALPDMLREAVEEVFEWLRPHRSKYKRNSEFEVPNSIVISYVVERWDRLGTSWRVHWQVDQKLIALENVFSALDGKGQISKTHYSEISNVIRAPGYAGIGETPYFGFRTWKNGNMHLRFKRADLLARFNSIAGGKRLKPSKEQADAPESDSADR